MHASKQHRCNKVCRSSTSTYWFPSQKKIVDESSVRAEIGSQSSRIRDRKCDRSACFSQRFLLPCPLKRHPIKNRWNGRLFGSGYRRSTLFYSGMNLEPGAALGSAFRAILQAKMITPPIRYRCDETSTQYSVALFNSVFRLHNYALLVSRWHRMQPTMRLFLMKNQEAKS